MSTGLAAGSTLRSADLDGRTTIRSPRIELPATAGQKLTFRWFFAHGSDSSAADHLRAIVEGPDTTQTVVWERTGSGTLTGGSWRTATVNLDAWAGQTVRIRFEALDAGSSSLVEAGVDDIRVTMPTP